MLDEIFAHIGYGNFILVLAILIFVHELGHYLAARSCGIRVEVFSIGFGPEIFGYNDRHGTRWKLSLIPLGGYVKMFGEMLPGLNPDQKSLTLAQEKFAFHTQPLWARAIVVSAGPLANFIYAFAVLWMVFFLIGKSETPDFKTHGIGFVSEQSPAEASGLQKDDKILAINDVPIHHFDDLRNQVIASQGKPLTLNVMRETQIFDVKIIPEQIQNDQGPSYRLGIGAQAPILQQKGLIESALLAAGETWNMIWLTLKAIGELISGQRDQSELGGPIKIAQISSDVAQTGLLALIVFTVILSVNLGLLNLLPVPILDGGYLLFCLYEAVTGAPPSAKVQNWAMRFGVAFIGTLIIFVTINDILSLF
ncbi:MAG: RIP metalloprotease RseP [Pseudomonadota bacterium]